MPRGSKSDERDQDIKTTAIETSMESKADTSTHISDVEDDEAGIITALVSCTGIQDSVKDIIVPGAYEKTLKERSPVVCWSHQWETPIGKVLDIKELMPGDPQLTNETLADGSSWPATAGALFARVQFNRKTDTGERAYQNVKFFSDSKNGSPWSIGFRSTKATKDKDGVRHIKELDLFECSPVLHGANRHAKTLSVKTLDEALNALAEGGYDTSQLDVKTVETEEFDGLAASEVKDLIAARDLLDAYLDELGVQSKRTVVEGDPDLEEPAERWVDSSQEDGPMSLYGELEQLLDPDDFAELLDLAAEFDDASDEGDDDAAGEVMSDFLDVYEALEEEDPELGQLRDVIADVIDDRYPELAEDDDAYYDDDESDEDDDESEYDDESEEYDDAEDVEGEAEEAPEADVEAESAAEKSHRGREVKSPSAAKRDRAEDSGAAMAGGKYPIENAADLKKAIGLRSQGNAPTKLINGHIAKRAKALGLEHMLPDDLKPSGSSGEKSLKPMSWGSEDATSLVMSAIEWN